MGASPQTPTLAVRQKGKQSLWTRQRAVACWYHAPLEALGLFSLQPIAYCRFYAVKGKATPAQKFFTPFGRKNFLFCP